MYIYNLHNTPGSLNCLHLHDEAFFVECHIVGIKNTCGANVPAPLSKKHLAFADKHHTMTTSENDQPTNLKYLTVKGFFSPPKLNLPNISEFPELNATRFTSQAMGRSTHLSEKNRQGPAPAHSTQWIHRETTPWSRPRFLAKCPTAAFRELGG